MLTHYSLHPSGVLCLRDSVGASHRLHLEPARPLNFVSGFRGPLSCIGVRRWLRRGLCRAWAYA
jgi:hypothetical protein